MTPFQRKIKSLGYSKYLPITFKDLPPRLNEDILKIKVNSLKKLIIENNNEAIIIIRNEIVGGHLRLGVSIAARFATKSKFRIDDLIGEMFLSLIESVTKFCTDSGYDDNITPYIITCIHSRLLEYIESDHTIYIPGRTVRYYSAIGSNKLDKLPHQIHLVQNGIIGRNTDESENSEEFSGPYVIPEIYDDYKINEILEILDKVTPNFIEKRIIELRVEGYSYKEISPLVGYSQSAISRMLSEIEQRFNKIYKKAT